ncbi:MAG: cytochrome c [Proteobacteria bacterium]|nr:cytochrome c [Pseudomonadota bacterium]
MLSKSQARLFFLGGTLFFSVIFIALTVDTLRQIPARSHQDRMAAEVVRGKGIWDKSNCMGCHTILGEGGYYAPELTKVVQRRGKEWIAIFLANPQAMFPGERKMVNYHFDDGQTRDVIAFLDWIGGIDTNGFPPKPDLVLPAAVAAANVNLAPPPVMFGTVCVACHSVGGKGGAVGPALDGVAHRKTPQELDRWLADPAAVKPGTAMPKLPIDDSTRAALVAWLSTLN